LCADFDDLECDETLNFVDSAERSGDVVWQSQQITHQATIVISLFEEPLAF